MSHSTANDPTLNLDLTEEDAYAHLCLIANEHAPEADKRKLIKAGLLPPPATDDSISSTAEKQNEMTSDGDRKTPLAVSSVLARGNAIRYLLAYASGSKPMRVMKELGICWGDVQRYRWLDPQFAVVQDFIERERHHLLALKAEAALDELLDGSAPKTVNAKAVLFTLERLRRETYSDPKRSDGGQATGKGGGITYNITFQGVQPPNLCGKCVDNPPPQPIIDIKSE